MQALETQAAKLRDVDPEKEQMLSSRKVEVEERFSKLLAPLNERRKKLDQFKRVQQVCSINDIVFKLYEVYELAIPVHDIRALLKSAPFPHTPQPTPTTTPCQPATRVIPNLRKALAPAAPSVECP